MQTISGRQPCEADTDGDGQTNGLELGDPCCLWSVGATPFYHRYHHSWRLHEDDGTLHAKLQPGFAISTVTITYTSTTTVTITVITATGTNVTLAARPTRGAVRRSATPTAYLSFADASTQFATDASTIAVDAPAIAEHAAPTGLPGAKYVLGSPVVRCCRYPGKFDPETVKSKLLSGIPSRLTRASQRRKVASTWTRSLPLQTKPRRRVPMPASICRIARRLDRCLR